MGLEAVLFLSVAWTVIFGDFQRFVTGHEMRDLIARRLLCSFLVVGYLAYRNSDGGGGTTNPFRIMNNDTCWKIFSTALDSITMKWGYSQTRTLKVP